jgi:hypothetical protein
MTIEERYADDPDLLTFYRKKLLEPGWAGELDTVEMAYIKSELRRSSLAQEKMGLPSFG